MNLNHHYDLPFSRFCNVSTELTCFSPLPPILYAVNCVIMRAMFDNLSLIRTAVT